MKYTIGLNGLDDCLTNGSLLFVALAEWGNRWESRLLMGLRGAYIVLPGCESGVGGKV